ncbi:MAG: hypothetical protein HYX65_08610 [Gemmatimonadetes bacterium]|nr:hypothetical protein [Gemmatimonadota bacterium]
MEAQTFKTHRRWLPLYHFVAFPITIINVFVVGYRLFKYGVHRGGIWDLIFAIGVMLAVLMARVMANTVQDRVIRLEMRLRLTGMLPDALKSRINDLTPRQLVGLRFASDAEMAGLVERCLSGELKDDEAVKKEVKNWVGDTLRA